MRIHPPRMPVIDSLKAVACILIVLHHLAYYGPMSDVAYPLMPQAIDWLFANGRLAVQVFFVIAGFLMVSKLAPATRSLVIDPVREIRKRYIRLVLPYCAALVLSIACAEVARGWMTHDSVPATPELLQLIAHVLLLQGLLGYESLSAGVWYVAIDFQLFAVTALLLRLSTHIEGRFPAMPSSAPAFIAALTVASLFVFNRNAWWSETALYFFGAYGLGALGYWAATRRRSLMWMALLGSLVLAALMVDFRTRIAVAGVTMLMLGLALNYALLERLPMPQFMLDLGRRSYSIFLVHFPVCLIVNAAFYRFLPQQPWVAVVGMLTALVASLMTGALLYKWIENPVPGNAIPAVFVASPVLVDVVGK
ncbi:MAG: acyltransferase [Herminiimonas sp.]|nr:acyltransferase [Herminiimonas sp.]